MHQDQQKRGKKAPLKIHYLKKTLKNSLFTRVEKNKSFLTLLLDLLKSVLYLQCSIIKRTIKQN